MRHRRDLYATLNAGFSASVSARALIMRLPIETSFAQPGSNPHLSATASRSSEPARMRTASTGCVGAML